MRTALMIRAAVGLAVAVVFWWAWLRADAVRPALIRMSAPKPLEDSNFAERMAGDTTLHPGPARETSPEVPLTDRRPRTGASEANTVRNSRGEEQLWRGGGVRSRSVADVQRALSALTFQARLPLTSFFRGDIALDLVRNLSRAVMRDTAQDDDCVFQLLPHHRAACIVAALIEANGTAGYGEGQDLWQDPGLRGLAWHRSYCSAMLPCLMWRRGAFTSRLTKVAAAAAYAGARRKQLSFVSRRGARAPLLPLFMHDTWRSPEFSVQRLLRRHRAAEAYTSFRAQRAKDLSQDMRSTAAVLDDRKVDIASAMFDNNTVAAVREYTADAKRDGVYVPTANGKPISGLLTPLEVLGVLHAQVTKGGLSPSARVVVFSGDSVMREVFMRLVMLVRSTNSEALPMGLFEPSEIHDKVYSVYETHDELTLCHSPYSSALRRETVTDFLRVRKSAVNADEEKLLLLRAIFFWDAQSVSRPRPRTYFTRFDTGSAAQAPANGKLPFATFEEAIEAAGVSRAVHIISHMFWEHSFDWRLYKSLAAASVATRGNTAAVAGDKGDGRNTSDADTPPARLIFLTSTNDDAAEPRLREAMLKQPLQPTKFQDEHLLPRTDDDWLLRLPRAQQRLDDRIFRNLSMGTIPLRANVLSKNRDLLEWVRPLLLMRDRVAKNEIISAGRRNGTKKGIGKVRWRFTESLAVLDFAKVQMMHFPQADSRHFMCRFFPLDVTDISHPRYSRVISEDVLNLLLSRGSLTADGQTLTPLYAFTSTSWLSKHLARKVFRGRHVVDFKADLWDLSGLKQAAAEATQDGPRGSKKVLHLCNRWEYGMFSGGRHQDLSGCRDPGNAFTLQLLAHWLSEKG